MTVTYSEPNPTAPLSTEETFVPSYARGSRKKKSVKTWMILAPIGALALLGGGAALMMTGEPANDTLVEEPATLSAPVQAPMSAPVESSTMPSTASIDPASVTPMAPAPVVREAAPTPPPAIRARNVQPSRAVRPVEAPAPVAREAAPVQPSGPTPYVAPSTTGSAATPPAPSISVAPLD